MGLGVQVRPRLEVADHDLRSELADQLVIRGDVLRDTGGAGEHVRPQRLAEPDAILVVDHVQAVDPIRALEPLAEELGGATRHHDLDIVVLLRHQVLEDHARSHRMSHAFADHSVEDFHQPTVIRPPSRSAAGISALGSPVETIQSWCAARVTPMCNMCRAQFTFG
jgi:hypothetical protein